METINDVQARLNTYRSNKQRKQRLAELHQSRSSDGYVSLLVAVEAATLMARLKGHKVTARQMMSDMRDFLESGEMEHRIGRPLDS